MIKSILVFTLLLIAVLLGGFGLGAVVGCGGGVIENTRKGLQVTVEVADVAQGFVQGDGFCRPVIIHCKKKKLNPCPAAETCWSVRKRLLKGFPQLADLLKVINDGLTVYEKVVADAK